MPVKQVPKSKIETIFSLRAIQYIASEIISNDGNEVYFVGNCSEDGIICDARVVARGNEDAVPVIFSEAYKGECVIHNHPSGTLVPSGNDIAIASSLGNQGIGFIIVNNAVNDCKVVVEITPCESINYLNEEKIINYVKPNGLISKKMPMYEYRQPQEEMLKLVCRAMNDNEIRVIEAGTGIGKSLAYLIPAILWSVQNKEKVVISTNTINLQQQLTKKDIPFLKKALNIDFNAVLVKGRSNYICLRKLHRFKNDYHPSLFENNEVKTANHVFEIIDQLKDGSKDELSFLPSYKIWDEISSDADTCNKQICNFTGDCFFIKARSAINKAHILIVNHHILCSDIAIKKEKDNFNSAAILPPYSKLVIDEAHNLEDSATSYFGRSVSPIGMKRAISMIYQHHTKKEKGIIPKLLFQLKNIFTLSPVFGELYDNIDKDIKPYLTELTEEVEIFFKPFFYYIVRKIEEHNAELKFRLTNKTVDKLFYEQHLHEGKFLVDKIRSVTNKLRNTLDKIGGQKKEWIEDIMQDLFEANALNNRLNILASTIENFLHFVENDHVYWVELKNKRQHYYIKLHISPLDISVIMKDSLLELVGTAILTSATLATHGNFNYISSRLGLSILEDKTCVTTQLYSPFDYTKQASVCIPTDIVEPNEKAFLDKANKYIASIVNMTRGSTFVLFTSFYQLNQCHDYISQTFNNQLNLLKQGTYDRFALIKTFKESDKCILFGTDSFWEGVDVEGNALKCVVITKLPFRVPSEPVIQARVERINEEGKNAFMEYYLPQTVLKFKQGFGRLIRSKTDKGLVIVLDKRIITKSYGKAFINSLPNCKKVVGNVNNILNEIKLYFKGN